MAQLPSLPSFDVHPGGRLTYIWSAYERHLEWMWTASFTEGRMTKAVELSPIVRHTENDNNFDELCQVVEAAGGNMFSQHEAFRLVGCPGDTNVEVATGWGIYISNPQKIHRELSAGQRVGCGINEWDIAGHIHLFTIETALKSVEYTGHRVVDWIFTRMALENPKLFRTRLVNLARRPLDILSRESWLPVCWEGTRY